jgi:hypothetical protein
LPIALRLKNWRRNLNFKLFARPGKPLESFFVFFLSALTLQL